MIALLTLWMGSALAAGHVEVRNQPPEVTLRWTTVPETVTLTPGDVSRVEVWPGPSEGTATLQWHTAEGTTHETSALPCATGALELQGRFVQSPGAVRLLHDALAVLRQGGETVVVEDRGRACVDGLGARAEADARGLADGWSLDPTEHRVTLTWDDGVRRDLFGPDLARVVAQDDPTAGSTVDDVFSLDTDEGPTDEAADRAVLTFRLKDGRRYQVPDADCATLGERLKRLSTSLGGLTPLPVTAPPCAPHTEGLTHPDTGPAFGETRPAVEVVRGEDGAKEAEVVALQTALQSRLGVLLGCVPDGEDTLTFTLAPTDGGGAHRLGFDLPQPEARTCLLPWLGSARSMPLSGTVHLQIRR